MSKRETKKRKAVNNAEKPEKKKSKTHLTKDDFAQLFFKNKELVEKKRNQASSSSKNSSNGSCFEPEDYTAIQSVSNQPSMKRYSSVDDVFASDVSQIERLTNKQLIEIVMSMSAVVEVTTNQLKIANKKLREHRTKAELAVRDTSEIDAPPLMELFAKYKLPIKTKEEIEALEAQLGESDDFLKFFVS